jgi:acyl carrier protein
MKANTQSQPGGTSDLDTVRASVRAFILSTFYLPPSEGLADGASLLEAGIIDSTGVLEIIGFLERTFRLKVEDDEIVPENLDSVDAIAAYVLKKRGF